jgi:ATP-binding cassette subfamily B protein
MTPVMTDVPPSVSNLFGTSQIRGHAVLLSIPTDVDEAGHAARQWMVLTEREVAVFAPADSCDVSTMRCLKSYPIDQIAGCRVQCEVGSGYLQVKQGGVWIDLLRFSNRLTPEFREAAHKLERLRRYRDFLISESPADERVCPRCGTRLRSADHVCTRRTPFGEILRRVAALLRPYYRTVAAIGALSLTAVALELVPPWLQKVLVDQVLAGKSEHPTVSWMLPLLATIVGCLAAVRLIAAVIAVAKARLSSEIGARLTAELRKRMVEKLQRLSVSYHDRNQVGMLMSRVSYDTEAMHTFMHQLSGGFVLQMLQMVAIGVMLFVLNAKLALMALLPTPLVLIATWFFCRTFYTRQHRYWDAVGRQAAALTALLSGIRVVKSFTQERREDAKFSETSERLRESRTGVDLAAATFSSLVGLLFALGGLIVWYVGGRDVLGDDMTLGSLMAFLAYLAMFYAPLTTISEGATWISSFLAASHRIFELLDTPVPADEPEGKRPVDQVRGHIQFHQVSFAYDDQKPALEDVSFEVQPGESVGIVGRSGSGKSTLASLISRLYDVDNGEITIDGIDVRNIDSNQLRRQVGMVLQEPFLFEGTVAANISYGNPEAAPERIIASAKAASAHDFILRMPFGYETPLGERGAGLSGGERQRVSIARAVLYDPRILILDEATSSIDAESEQLIQRALARFTQGRTTLTIAHRLSTLEHADRLLVLDRGRLVELGTHRELLAAGGIYARLIRLQFGDRERPDEDSNGRADATEELQEGLSWEVRWLDAGCAKLSAGSHGVLTLELDGQHYSGVYIVRAFPATHSEELLSLRCTQDTGRDVELGMIRRLLDWPQPTRELLLRALNRRYLLRVIKSFDSFREENGFVNCAAETDDGDIEFIVRNSPASVKRFGERGRLLTDLDDNHYVVPDLDDLPAAQKRFLNMRFQEL